MGESFHAEHKLIQRSLEHQNESILGLVFLLQSAFAKAAKILGFKQNYMFCCPFTRVRLLELQ